MRNTKITLTSNKPKVEKPEIDLGDFVAVSYKEDKSVDERVAVVHFSQRSNLILVYLSGGWDWLNDKTLDVRLLEPGEKVEIEVLP